MQGQPHETSPRRRATGATQGFQQRCEHDMTQSSAEKASGPPAVLITGESRGIGAACAQGLHARGFHIFAGVLTEPEGEQVVARLGTRCTPLVFDVTNADQIANAASVVHATVGTAGLRGLVNCAGMAVGGPMEFLPIDVIRKQLEVNLIGQIAVTQALLPELRAGVGRIVFISSASGYLAAPFLCPYAMSKFAIEALGDSWRMELKRSGVRVSIVEPGIIKTPIWEASGEMAEALAAQMPPEADEYYAGLYDQVRSIVARIPDFAAPPERVAKVVVHAITAKKPRTRYMVGIDAYADKILARWLPDRVRDRIVGWFFRI